ncbi:UNVERIFIED_CONTAM: Ptk7 [Trichonephila clavipes]
MVIVNVHGSFDITCLVPNGLPKPKMWWENPKGHVINDSGRIHVEDMRLIFSEVEESDDGEYSCVAENIADKRNVSFSLVVSAPPVIVDHPTDLTIDEGGEADFVCGFGNSSAVVYWLKDNIYLKDTGNHIILNDNNLTIRNVASSDAGTYHCEVKSEGFPPVFSEGAFLSVKEKLKFIPSPVNRKLELGSNAKIYCKAGGSTPPVVKWSRIDIRSTEWPPHIRDDNGTLHFNRVLSTDSGKYMCVATNSQGIINATIDVDVIGIFYASSIVLMLQSFADSIYEFTQKHFPYFLVMPKFSVQPSDTVADEGDPVILHCLAEGDPVPIIQWDKNNELNGFNHKTFRVLENGSLFASEINLEDEGKYGCTAGNSGGLRRHEVILIVKAKESTTKVGSTGFEDEEESTMTKTVAITLGAAGIYIVLVVGLMMWCRYRRAKRKALMLAQATADAENSEPGNDIEMRDRTSPKTLNDLNACGGESSTEHLKNSEIGKLLLKDKLSPVMLLGHGEYGEVILAKTEELAGGNLGSVVMVKVLESNCENVISEFNDEVAMYSKMKHENVGTVLGLCEDTLPQYAIMDYTDFVLMLQFFFSNWNSHLKFINLKDIPNPKLPSSNFCVLIIDGDLKQFLLATRPEGMSRALKQSPLSLAQNLMICRDIALGMEYLSKHFIHKDLATRNILISSDFKIKVSCPSLSMDTYAQEYYHHESRILPLRWTPFEVIKQDKWSTKSDVWAFAIMVWEIFSKAELPYADMANEDIIQKLHVGKLTLSIPENMPSKLVKLMERCWSQNPNERPFFPEIAEIFSELFIAAQM